MLNTALAFLLALAILIVFHEFGHFYVARLFNVRVIRFAVGFGKPLLKKRFSPDGTEFVLAAVPLGGYVRMVDERDPESLNVPNLDLNQAFNRKPVHQRMLIVLAGPVMNLLLAIVFYASVQMIGYSEPVAKVAQPIANTFASALGLEQGDRVIQVNGIDISGWNSFNWQVMRSVMQTEDVSVVIERQGIQKQLVIENSNPLWPALSPSALTNLGLLPLEKNVIVRKVVEGSAAEKAGLLVGDQIISADTVQLYSSGSLTQMIRASEGNAMTLHVLRDAVALSLTVTPDRITDDQGRVIGRLGVGLGGDLDIQKTSMGLLDAITYGVKHTWEVSTFSLAAFYKMITGQMSFKMLSGPVSIADAAGQSAKLGLAAYLGFLAMVSVSLGVLNLLPVPLLDGGHLMYYLAEFVRGKPLPDIWFEWGQRVGLALIALMTVLALFNDVQRLM